MGAYIAAATMNGETQNKAGIKERHKERRQRTVYLRPVDFCCDLMTFLTTLASSIKNARTTLHGRTKG